MSKNAKEIIFLFNQDYSLAGHVRNEKILNLTTFNNVKFTDQPFRDVQNLRWLIHPIALLKLFFSLIPRDYHIVLIPVSITPESGAAVQQLCTRSSPESQSNPDLPEHTIHVSHMLPTLQEQRLLVVYSGGKNKIKV